MNEDTGTQATASQEVSLTIGITTRYPDLPTRDQQFSASFVPMFTGARTEINDS